MTNFKKHTLLALMLTTASYGALAAGAAHQTETYPNTGGPITADVTVSVAQTLPTTVVDASAVEKNGTNNGATYSVGGQFIVKGTTADKTFGEVCITKLSSAFGSEDADATETMTYSVEHDGVTDANITRKNSEVITDGCYEASQIAVKDMTFSLVKGAGDYKVTLAATGYWN